MRFYFSITVYSFMNTSRARSLSLWSSSSFIIIIPLLTWLERTKKESKKEIYWYVPDCCCSFVWQLTKTRQYRNYIQNRTEQNRTEQSQTEIYVTWQVMIMSVSASQSFSGKGIDMRWHMFFSTFNNLYHYKHVLCAVCFICVRVAMVVEIIRRRGASTVVCAHTCASEYRN